MTSTRAQSRDTARIVIAGLSVAALDFLYVTVRWVLIARAMTVQELAQSIARGLLGKAAYQGGPASAALGIGLHLVIAFSWTIAFYLLSRRIPALRRAVATTSGRIWTGLLWGPVIWLAMDFIVLPLSRARATPVSSPNFYINLVQHAIMIGLPMALILGPPSPHDSASSAAT